MNFLITEISKFLLFWVLSYVLGNWVFHRNVKVNYTRKIHHFSLLFIPLFFATYFPYDRSGIISLIGSLAFVWTLFPFIFREKNTVIQRCFLGIDRPEDRPHTLLWLFTQFLASIMVIIPIAIVSEVFFDIAWENIGLFVICLAMIGDGFAEPVGVRFGKRRYKTFALFTRKRYFRTVEGSLAVFVSTLLVVIVFNGLFTSEQFLYAILIFPLAITITEALSPHTWDSPFLLGVSGLGVISILAYL